MMIHIEVVHFL